MVYSQKAGMYYSCYAEAGSKLNQCVTVDGDTVCFRKNKKVKVKQVFVFSINNENTEFFVEAVTNSLSDDNWPVLLVNNKYYQSKNKGLSVEAHTVTFRVNREQAEEIAKAYHVPCNLRKHFGHVLQFDFIPLKDDYKAGDSVYINFKIINSGTVPVYYNHGGMSRNSNGRCDYFDFDVYYNGILLPDEGPEWNFGGLEGHPELKAGQTDTIVECITKWSHFRKRGKYTIKCSYRLHLEIEQNHKDFPANQADVHKVWDEKIEKTIEIIIVE